MSQVIKVEPLTAEAFAPFGHVIQAHEVPSFMINDGRCGRTHDLARPDHPAGSTGKVALSVARSEPQTLPLTLRMMERHPLGSQAFVPMQGARMVVIVAPDAAGKPGVPRAFLSTGNQGVQYRVACWHGVLAPLSGPSDFLIVDWVEVGDNLEEHILDTPWTVTASA